jgi:predicted transcriptional regulator
MVKSSTLPVGRLAMAKEAVFTVKLESELRDAFVSEARALDLPASHLVRQYMREFVQRQRDAREYDAWLRRKVEAGRADADAGRGDSNENVEARFARRRAEVLGAMAEAGE